MATLPIGALLLIAALMASTPLSSWPSFLNVHSMLIVIGGTIAIFAMCTPWQVVRALIRDLRHLAQRSPEINDHSAEFEELSETRRLQRPSTNPLINYAVELWDNGTSPDIFHVLLSQRREKVEGTSAEAVQAMRNMAKYPPALGMTGTVMGLVSLFLNLSADNRSAIGPALGLALTATFFGLIVANGFIMPLSDRLHVAHMRRRAYMQSCYEIISLVNRREPTTLIRGEVKDRVAEVA